MWGKHLALDIARAAPHTIRCPQTIYTFTKDLVKKIDMVAYGEPQIVMFGTGNKKGYTLVQLIETSNICAHFCEETNDIYLDVFSCKDFDPMVVRDVVNEYFKTDHMSLRMLDRQAPRQMLSRYPVELQ
jgi:S-adenosylmethionine/arginine decarboxylase-like enzyme